MEARLLVHPDDPAGPAGVRVGVLFELDPGWHLYWHNPGESGLPTELRWYGSAGPSAEVAWPAPSSFREAEGRLVTYGYAGRVLLATRVFPAPAGAGPRVLGVEVDALVCNSLCLPVRLRLERAWPSEGGEVVDQDEVRALFARSARRVPRSPASLGWRLDVRYAPPRVAPGDRFSAEVSLRPCASPDAPSCVVTHSALQTASFYPHLQEGLEVEATGLRPRPDDPDTWALGIEGRAAGSVLAAEGRLRGVLVMSGEEPAALDIDLPLPAGEAAAGAAGGAAAGGAPGHGLLGVLVLGCLGGLLLNLMPCVFPVLALKAVALAELAGRSRREVVAQVGAYTAGILLALLALAGVVLALRMGGTSVGWGFHLQEPRFVTALGVALVLFAANLLGAFEFGLGLGRLGELGAQARGATRSFCDGLLAVALATPCSAPFLGTAVGFAFARSAVEIVLVFLSIGVGLAAPYAALALSSRARARLPRPGAWMVQLRSALGFGVLAVVVWLVWILGRHAGVDGAALLLTRLWAVGLLAWGVGVWQRRASWRGPYGLGAVMGVVALAALPGTTPDDTGSGIRSFPYEAQRVEQALAAGQRVFAYFTADWCITCKVNEVRVLGDERVERALAAADVSVFRADWTRRDERIRAELARYGRAGVPTYVVRLPGADRAEILPELLTVEALLRALGGGDSSVVARSR